MPGKAPDPQQKTVEALLAASKRTSESVQIRRDFVQQGTQRNPIPGPLHRMVRAHDERALDLFLIHRVTASRADWDTTHEATVWARALGLPTPKDSGAAAVSKVWVKLDRNYRLVHRERRGRLAKVTSLLEDGSGAPYVPPKGSGGQKYIRLPFAYWTDDERWYRTLSLRGKAVLLIALSLKSPFKLPTERAPKWYGISADTAERGLRELQDRKVLSRSHILREDWLSGTVTTREYHYTVLDPFVQTTTAGAA